MKKTLKGITWNHSRGYTPIIATTQRFEEVNSDIKIVWEKRSLQEFADYPIGELALKYDLLVIDHPWAGYASDSGVLVPLEKHLPKEYLEDQAKNSVGKSYESYTFNGSQYALAIDAATPVASYRKDLFERDGLSIPKTWDDLLDLGRKGKVIFPALEVDILMDFIMLCATQGEDPFVDDEFVSDEMGTRVLEQLKELTSLCSPEIYKYNPIKIYEILSNSDDYSYCPFAFSYSNYARLGYSNHPLQFTDMVSINSSKMQSTLGGTGIAVSSKSKYIDEAIAYAKFVSSPECQNTIYFENGGQPGHRSAWLNERVNNSSNRFFLETLAAQDRAYLRPRYNGYIYFQDHGGQIIQDYLQNGGNPKKFIAKLKDLYHQSKGGKGVETT